MSRAMNRADRLREMERLYRQRGFTDIEMAERLGVHRSTVFKDRRDLEKEVPIFQDEDGRYRIDRTLYLSHIRVNLHEALALYLAARRMSRQTRVAQPHVAEAVSKLAAALKQPMTEKLVKAADAVLSQRADRQRVRVMEQLAEAWVEQVKVRIIYRALKRRGHSLEHVVHPYLVEPSLWSDGTYLIAYSERMGEVVPFKVERIERATLQREGFELPEDFDEQRLLRHAWSIWYSEEEPEMVVLKFAPGRATRRVQESVWHPQQEIEPAGDGGCIWRAPVDEWREMLPWIRGWGADVEVLAPAGLREEVARGAQQMARTYADRDASTGVPTHLLPYAKTERGGSRVHRLLYHLVDVGQVALLMWQEALPEGVQRHVAGILDLDAEEAGRLLAFLVALHDLGKASPGYQDKYAPVALKKELASAGLALSGYSLRTMDAYHSTVTAWALNEHETLVDRLQMDRRFARKIAQALGGHHGVWPIPAKIMDLDDDERWQAVRDDLVWELKAVFQPPAAPTRPEKEAANAFLAWLSGFTSVADWVGSMENYFLLEDRPLHARRYAERTREQARQALSELGWLGWQPRGERLTFVEMFPFIQEARPLQRQVIDAAEETARPTLLILEAPTGIGKTEVALYLADTWLQEDGGRGLYVAMPTQATSNQIFDRTQEFLAHRYPGDLVNLHLVHGQALWSEAMEEIQLHTVGEEGDGRVAAMSWFNRQRKRTLLAPFGVGTVDQALLSILQTKHFFVRLFGVGHKVVIFDEVHAYDTYMNTLFHRLLSWLRRLNTSVIVLSATLPAQTRREMVEAFNGRALPEEDGEPAYPALTLAPAGEAAHTLPLDRPQAIDLGLEWLDSRDPSAVARFLDAELAEGGCAAVVCNTVRRAQDVYRALQEADLALSEENLVLFHARFPPVWRGEIEKRVLGKFGKPGGDGVERPEKAVVVATQVIEQSLDLDFDVMISDLAPIDLLLQRAGRLHRHQRGPRRCPRRLVLVPPRMDGDLPHFTRADVYEAHFLLRTYAALRERPQITLPADTSTLIEAVYGRLEQAPPAGDRWAEAFAETAAAMEKAWREAANKAARNLVFAPDNARLLNQSNVGLEEEDPTVHQTFRAQTRDIDPGVTLICLHRHGERVTLDTEAEGEAVDLEAAPAGVVVRHLLQRAITVHHWGVLNHFLEREAPAAWREHSALRHTRLALFEDGVCRLPGTPFSLTLDRELGLTIEKEDR